jgi:hypothetical protein
MEAATFLVREKGLNPKPFRIQATCLVCGRQIREQIQWRFIPFGPATEEHDWPISLCLGFAVHRYMNVLLHFISNTYEKLLKGTSQNACIYVDGIKARQ